MTRTLAADRASSSSSLPLSPLAKRLRMDGIRALWDHATPSTISFLAGQPDLSACPIKGLSVTVETPSSSKRSEPLLENLSIDGIWLEKALAYGPSGGLPELKEWWSEFSSRIHNRERNGDWGVAVGGGGQELLTKAVHLLVTPGDTVLCEVPVYPGTLTVFDTVECQLEGIEQDADGLNVEQLRSTLENWPTDKAKPKLLYTIPVGGNPSGTTIPTARKIEVLKVCDEHGIIILEDDPYLHLSTGPVETYFALERKIRPSGGIVVRFDSLSKVFAGGIRLGFMLAPPELVTAMVQMTSAMNLHTSGISQVVALKCLEYFEIDGFVQHTRKVAEVYRRRRDWFEALAHQYLDDVATWVSPTAGMFIYINTSPIPCDEAFEQGLAEGVLCVPGRAFLPKAEPTTHIRLSFSQVTPAEAEEGMKRLRQALITARQTRHQDQT